MLKRCVVTFMAVAVLPALAAFGQVETIRGGAGYEAMATSLADQTDIAVTVYNNNLALVRDRRDIKLVSGEVSLTFMDVAQQIMPETVSLSSLSEPGSIRILEQNYEYDLMSPAKLMEKYVGKGVRLVNFSTEVGFTEVDAVLLSVNQGPIYQVENEIFLGHPGTVVLPEIPANLIAKPSLVWLLENGAGDQEVEVTYLTHGMSWRADYVLTYDEGEGSMDVAAWVTLNNQSGAPYVNARLKVVAGEVNIVRRGGGYGLDGRLGKRMMAMAEAAPMQEESFAEYHLYTLPRRTTIKENQSKQVSLFTASSVSVKKVYEYRGNVSYYNQKMPPQLPIQQVGVFLTFWNRETNQLGVPLPGGIMRIYQEDSEGMLQFSGEDRIKHTPKDEEVRLHTGNAFDIVGERIQTDFSRISNRVYESAYEIKIRNHKETAVTVDVVEPMPADWTVLASSRPHVKKDAHTAVFSLPVKPDEEVTLTYRVRVRY